MSSIAFILSPRSPTSFAPSSRLPLRLFSHKSSSSSVSHRTPPLSRAGHVGYPHDVGVADTHLASNSTIPSSEIAASLVSAGLLESTDVPLLAALTPPRAALFARALRHRTRHITLVLDGVHGPHNLAAIARSCDAWGLQDLHFITPPREAVPAKGSRAPRPAVPIIHRFESDQSVRNVSKNCHKWLSMHEHPTPTACVSVLRAAGYRLAVSSLDPSARPISELDLSHPTAFVFGNERLGVTPLMTDAADQLFTIPMVGFVESVNVSVAVATTACMAVPAARSAPGFNLPLSEARTLAHEWLKRRAPNRTAKRTPMLRGDVTRLGAPIERRIAQEGLFTTTDEPSKLSDVSLSRRDDDVSIVHDWKSILRLDIETGTRLATYVTRRKFGALEDRGWSKRCETATFSFAGPHALTVEAAVLPTVSRTASARPVVRDRLLPYFRDVCDAVHELYSPLFDSSGEPILPAHAPESENVMRAAGDAWAEKIAPVIQKMAFEEGVFGATEPVDGPRAWATICEIVEKANLSDVSRCIAESMRCDEERIQAMEAEAISASSHLFDLQNLLKTRSTEAAGDAHSDNVDFGSLFSPADSGVQIDAPAALSNEQRVVLHVLLRMGNAAFLISELHQTTWDRAMNRRMARIRGMRYNLLESVVCDAFSEMVLLGQDDSLALLRVALEWSRLLVPLKRHMKNAMNTLSDTATAS